MLLLLSLLASSLDFAVLQKSSIDELVPFEPIQYLKFQSASVNESSFWNQLIEAGPEEIGQLASSMKRNLRDTLREAETVIFAKGERIIAKKLSTKGVLSKLSKVPYANLVALFSVSMTILLEGFQPTLINKPIGEVLKGKHLSNSLVQEYKSKSLLEILCLLSVNSKAPVDYSNVLISDLNKNGEAAMYFVNSVLGDSASEAWMDALMAFNIENPTKDPNQLKLSLQNLFQYALTVIHDFRHMQRASDINLPLQNRRYMFGWWINCPESHDCLFSNLPQDLIFSVSDSLRIYVSPTYELSLIVSDSKPTENSFREVVAMDMVIWKQIYSTFNVQIEDSAEFEHEGIEASTQTDSSYFLFIHKVWPILVFVFWVVSSHIWVYWMFHCCWFFATSLSKRTHIPRPKVAGK